MLTDLLFVGYFSQKYASICGFIIIGITDNQIDLYGKLFNAYRLKALIIATDPTQLISNGQSS